jgi:ABC-type multidrug transport system fused ATPase/permease subunit
MNRERRRQLFATMAMMLVGAAAETIAIGAVIPFLALIASPNPTLVPDSLRHVLGLAPGGPVVGAALLLAVAGVMAAVARLLLLWMTQAFAMAWGGDLATLVFGRMLRQPYSAYLDRNSSELLAGLEKVQRVVSIILQPALQGAIAAVLALCIAALLFTIHPLAATITTVSIGLAYALIMLLTANRLTANSVIVAREITARNRISREALGGIRDVILDRSQASFEEAFALVETHGRRAVAQSAFIAGAPRYLLETTGIVALSFVAVALSARDGGILGAVPILGVLALGAQRLLPLLQQAWVGWSQASANVQLLVDVADLVAMPVRDEVLAQSAPLPFREVAELDSVSFIYSNGRCALDGVSLSIRRGERLGITGVSGSGKTTLIDVIMGFLEPTSGTMKVDGRRLDSALRSAWQRNISHVSQSTYLSDNTIAANVTFGAAGTVDGARLQRALEIAQLAPFVASLPEGISTNVGERGVRLSGGQRQRLGVARALYRRAPVLVLDEATSALDESTELALVEALGGLGGEMTMIIVSHRAATLALCNRVITLDQGRIA